MLHVQGTSEHEDGQRTEIKEEIGELGMPGPTEPCSHVWDPGLHAKPSKK